MRKNKIIAQKPFSILTLDDDSIMTSTIQAYFQRSGYHVDVENDPYQAIERIRKGSYDILMLDFLMSPICGDQVVAQIRKFNKELFIILLTGHKSMAPPIRTIRELDIQGYYEKSDRFDQLELLVESCVKSLQQMQTIKDYQKELGKAYQTMQDGYMETVTTLRSIVETRDIETRGHSDRVSKLARDIAVHMGLVQEAERIRVAGLFHDIGKVGVPDRILLKPGRLTREEFDEIRKHPEAGARILAGLSQFSDLVPIVRGHHERMDGSGYPDGLAGEAIPLGARIIAVADSFDAMISNRQYRRRMSLDKAFSELVRCRGTQFDPQIVDAFRQMLEQMGSEGFMNKYGSEGEAQ